MKHISFLFVVFFLLLGSLVAKGQSLVIDEVIAIVGDKKVLYSDIEKAVLQMKEQGDQVSAQTRCTVLEQLLTQKLLMNQAEVDSLVVTDSQIEGELDSRMQYFINVFGTQEKLENYFNKSVIEIKQDSREEIREMLLSREMRRKITEGLSVTPSEVRAYYRGLPQDSLPYIDAEVEYNQILIYPRSSEQAIIDAREKLLTIREKVLNGESFITQAVINSEDGSAIKGGDIGWMAKAELDPEYAKAAFALKKGAISKIVESSFGFHLIQCIDKTEDRIHTRHILVKPKVDPEEARVAIARLDSIIRLVRLDSLKFEDAAKKHSQDEDSRINGGQAVNNMRGGVRWELDEFQPQEFRIINNLKVGEISNPYETIDTKGKAVYKVIWLKKRTNPHVGNLKEDYNLFKTKTLQIKEEERVNEWITDKIKTTYIRISEDYTTCGFRINGWLKP